MPSQSPAPAPMSPGPASGSTMKIMSAIAAVVVIAGGAYWLTQSKPSVEKQTGDADQTDTSGKTVLTYAAHWSDYQVNGVFEDGQLKSKGLKQYLNEYEQLNPDVKFELLYLPYGEYPSKLKLLHDSDVAPDIYQVYSTWGVSFVRDNMLAAVPSDVEKDIKDNYVSAGGVTIDGKIRAIPSEVNDLVLLYNKDMFKAAGIVDASGNARAPRNWQEVVDAAVKTTKKNANGEFLQYGFAFLRDIDAYVTDPFLSLLFSNNGNYLSDDLKTCRLDEPAGIEALDAMLGLFRKGTTNIDANQWDFGKEKVAMVIMAPWTQNNLKKQGLGDRFDSVVGITPIPGLKKSTSLQYSWMLGVMEKSKNKDKAWDFLRWFTSEAQPGTGTTRYGDLLAQTIGAIPSRESDIAGNQAVLGGTSFRRTFVDELANSVAEPNVFESSKIKEILMNEIQASWTGQKSAKEALGSACTSIEDILSKYY